MCYTLHITCGRGVGEEVTYRVYMVYIYIHEDSRTCYYYIYMKFSCVCSMLIGKALVWGSFFDSTKITHSSVIIARTHSL